MGPESRRFAAIAFEESPDETHLAAGSRCRHVGGAAAPAVAQAPAGKPDLERAQKTAIEVCLACHGPNGNSVVPANPSLAGQPAEYITLQLAHFKSGLRTNPIMQGIASTLTPEDMRGDRNLLLPAEAEGTGSEGCCARRGGAEALSRRRHRQRRSRMLGLPLSEWRAASRRTIRASPGNMRITPMPSQKAFKARRARRGQGWQGRERRRSWRRWSFRMTEAQMKAVAEYASGLR